MGRGLVGWSMPECGIFYSMGDESRRGSRKGKSWGKRALQFCGFCVMPFLLWSMHCLGPPSGYGASCFIAAAAFASALLCFMRARVLRQLIPFPFGHFLIIIVDELHRFGGVSLHSEGVGW
jgi:hypothetical protein